MRVTNVGGSLTTALLLSGLAWGIRLLRAKNVLRPVERPPKPATRVPSKALFGRLTPIAFRFLLDQRPIPFVIVDVRTAEEVAEQPAAQLGVSQPPLHVPEPELAAVMRPRGKAWLERFRAPPPSARQTVVFLCSDGARAARCAAAAANLGYQRCAVLEGGLDALAAPPPAAAKPAGVPVSRDALAVLLERLGAASAGPSSVLLLDVRRPDERAMYGSIAGALSLPAEQLPRAMAMGPEEFGRTFRFPRPLPLCILVLHSRGERRARWCAQLAADAGYQRVLVLERGTAGWRLDAGVKAYTAYADGDVPPLPQPFLVEAVDAVSGEQELSRALTKT